MEIWIAAVCAAAVLIAAVLLTIDKSHRQKQLLRMKRMQNSPFWEAFSKTLHTARRHPIDQVLIERDRIIFKGMNPPEVVAAFSFSEHNLRYLNEQKRKTFRDLLAEEMPDLSDSARYRLRSYRVVRPDGSWDRAWEYVARSAYKSYVMRTLAWRETVDDR